MKKYLLLCLIFCTPLLASQHRMLDRSIRRAQATAMPSPSPEALAPVAYLASHHHGQILFSKEERSPKAQHNLAITIPSDDNSPHVMVGGGGGGGNGSAYLISPFVSPRALSPSQFTARTLHQIFHTSPSLNANDFAFRLQIEHMDRMAEPNKPQHLASFFYGAWKGSSATENQSDKQILRDLSHAPMSDGNYNWNPLISTIRKLYPHGAPSYYADAKQQHEQNSDKNSDQDSDQDEAELSYSDVSDNSDDEGAQRMIRKPAPQVQRHFWTGPRVALACVTTCAATLFLTTSRWFDSNKQAGK